MLYVYVQHMIKTMIQIVITIVELYLIYFQQIEIFKTMIQIDFKGIT